MLVTPKRLLPKGVNSTRESHEKLSAIKDKIFSSEIQALRVTKTTLISDCYVYHLRVW